MCGRYALKVTPQKLEKLELRDDVRLIHPV